MALREVKPLNEKQWQQVTTALKTGPTEEQKRLVAKALEIAHQLKELKD